MAITRRLSRTEFEDLFLALYPWLIKVTDCDLVHTVYVAVIEQALYKDIGRNQKAFKAWYMGLVKDERKVQYRREKREFGRRRVNERD